MGEKYHTGRAAGVSPLVVVVSEKSLSLHPFTEIQKTPHFSVFWDLYCAAPERRETCDHSSEAKAFHDYVSSKVFT